MPIYALYAFTCEINLLTATATRSQLRGNEQYRMPIVVRTFHKITDGKNKSVWDVDECVRHSQIVCYTVNFIVHTLAILKFPLAISWNG